MEITQHTLRATFHILRSQLRLSDKKLKLKAINEFSRELGVLWHEAIDIRAQAAGRSYEEELAIVEEEAKQWTAEPPRIT